MNSRTIEIVARGICSSTLCLVQKCPGTADDCKNWQRHQAAAIGAIDNLHEWGFRLVASQAHLATD